MSEQEGRHVDDALTEQFDRVVRLAGRGAPALAELEGRVTARHARRRRNQRRVAAAGCLAVVALLALVAYLVAPSSDGTRRQELVTDPTVTVLPVDEEADPVFTVDVDSDALAFLRCDPVTSPQDASEVIGVSCLFDDPATVRADGLTLTRTVDGVTPALAAAWDAGDAPAVGTVTGTSDVPADARFATVGGRRVVDLTSGGQPFDGTSGTLLVRIDDQLIQLGAAGAPPGAVDRIVESMTMGPPTVVVSEALRALPEGSVALIQGVRPLEAQPDATQPNLSSPFGGTTIGAEIAVPGARELVGIDITTGIDADALLDAVLAVGDPGTTEEEIAGRRAVAVGPTGALPTSVPEPRFGPQVLVRLSDATLVRIKQPDGDPALVRAIAESFR